MNNCKYVSRNARPILELCECTLVEVTDECIVLLEILLLQYYPKAVLKWMQHAIRENNKERTLSYFVTILFHGVLKGARIKDAPDVRMIPNVVEAYRLLSNFVPEDFSKTEFVAIGWMGMNREAVAIRRAMQAAVRQGIRGACYVKAIVSSAEYAPKKDTYRVMYKSVEPAPRTQIDDIKNAIEADKLFEESK